MPTNSFEVLWEGHKIWKKSSLGSVVTELHNPKWTGQSMATANLKKSEEFVTNTTAASKYIPRRPRISINWNPTFQTSLHKISKVIFFRLTKFFFRNKNFFSKEQLLFSFLCIVKQKKFRSDPKIFENFHFWKLLQKKRLKGGISIYADFGPPRYALWCCGGICHELLTFFQIGCGHTVWLILFQKKMYLVTLST